MLRLSFSLGKPYGFSEPKSQQNERRRQKKVKWEIEWKNQEPKVLEIGKMLSSFIWFVCAKNK